MFRYGVFLLLTFLTANPLFAHDYGWLPQGRKGINLSERYSPPTGFSRIEIASGSFAAYLRHLPLKPKSARVRDYRGRRLFAPYAAAVIDIDVGAKDLQQCADTLIRLWAEYQRGIGKAQHLVFNFTSGDAYAYADFLKGKRPVVRGDKVSWRFVAGRNDSRPAFRNWLNIVFMYAGTASLARDLGGVNPTEAQIGDLFITPGFPGHTAMIADIAENARGERRFLLVEGFTPAQDAHVVKASILTGSVWHELGADGALDIGFWQFSSGSLHRF